MDMPMKKKRTVASQAAARGPLPELPTELLDQLVKGPMTPVEVQDLMLAFNKAVIERATSAAMSGHGLIQSKAEPPRKRKKPLRKIRNGFDILAPRPGLEPGTYGLTVRRSTD